jgi:hypothetical protein
MVDRLVAASQQQLVPRTPIPLTRPNVAIVGFSEGHLAQAPFDDPTYEMWGINRLHINADVGQKRWDRWFNIHDLEKFHGEDAEHLAFLKQFEGPVYLRSQDIGKYDVPNGVPFPADRLLREFPVGYFNNTISWLIAFALLLDPKELAVFGVDMAQDALINAEYAAQRPSCEYFLGIASGRGIPVHLPAGSDLLAATHLYGFEDPDVFTQKLLNRMQETGERKEKVKVELAQFEAQAAAQRQNMVNAINQLDGAMQDCQYWLRNWVPQTAGEPHKTESVTLNTVG